MTTALLTPLLWWSFVSNNIRQSITINRLNLQNRKKRKKLNLLAMIIMWGKSFHSITTTVVIYQTLRYDWDKEIYLNFFFILIRNLLFIIIPPCLVLSCRCLSTSISSAEQPGVRMLILLTRDARKNKCDIYTLG